METPPTIQLPSKTQIHLYSDIESFICQFQVHTLNPILLVNGRNIIVADRTNPPTGWILIEKYVSNGDIIYRFGKDGDEALVFGYRMARIIDPTIDLEQQQNIILTFTARKNTLIDEDGVKYDFINYERENVIVRKMVKL